MLGAGGAARRQACAVQRRAHVDVAEPGDVKDAVGRVLLVARALQDGNEGIDRPARRELEVDVDVVEVLVVLDLGVEDFALNVFFLAAEVAEGAEGAPVDLNRDGVVVQELADRGGCIGKAALHGGVGVGGETALGAGDCGHRPKRESEKACKTGAEKRGSRFHEQPLERLQRAHAPFIRRRVRSINRWTTGSATERILSCGFLPCAVGRLVCNWRGDVCEG